MAIQPDISKNGSAVDAAADVLREEILTIARPGAFIGSVDELADRLGISRPTLRQALRILETENLLVARRGRSGGFFACPPTSEPLSKAASAYLRAEEVPHEDLLEISQLLTIEAARIVAMKASPADVRAIRMLAATPLKGAGPEEVLQTGLAMNALLRKLSGKPALALFMEVLENLTLDVMHQPEEIQRHEPLHGALLERTNRALARAIAARDPDRAAEALRKHYAKIMGWSRRGARKRASAKSGAGAGSV